MKQQQLQTNAIVKPSRPFSANQIPKQDQINGAQNEQLLQQLRNLQQQIVELQVSQGKVCQQFKNDLNNVIQQTDSISSMIDSLSSHQISSQNEQQKKKSIIQIKSSIQSEPLQIKKSQISEQPMEQIQKKKINIQNRNLIKVNSDLNFHSEQKQLDVQFSQTQSGGFFLNKQNFQINRVINQQQLRQHTKLQFTTCILCNKKLIGQIEATCGHFFDKNCLKQHYDEQLMNLNENQGFQCICGKILPQRLFIKQLDINKEILFQKQLNILYKKYQSKFQKCKNCQIFWILNIYSKTNSQCFNCHQQLIG